MPAVIDAFGLVFTPEVLIVVVLASLYGLFVGSIPGLTATMAVALLIPVTFFMDPIPAIAAMVTTVAMAIFAGDIPGALLRVPGTPASAAYADEAFAMTRKGQAQKALSTGLVCASIGGTFGTIVLILASQELAAFALNFTQFEFFWLVSLGLTSAAFVSSSGAVKGAVSLLIGLLIATVGIGINSPHPRFSMGVPDLMGGVSFIPAMIGMFAISEILRNMAAGGVDTRRPVERVSHLFQGLGPRLYRYKLNILRGSAVGTAVGVLPGAGGDIAAWVAYALAKRFSKTPEKFGTGHAEGIAEAGAANNSALVGAWIPALVFGIPGDSVTAVVIGVMLSKGITPGPTVFQYQPELIFAIFVVFLLANLLLLPFGFLAIAVARQVLRIPASVIWPIILVFAIVGAFAINNALANIIIMLVLGILAFIMEENGFPIAPAILGIVLGRMLEENFLAGMIKSNGSILGFFDRPIAAALGIATLAIWISPLVSRLAARYRRHRTMSSSDAS